MTFRPLADRVIIRPDAPVTETLSGLQVPETAATVDYSGLVLAVGAGVEEVAKGDRVVFGLSVGQDLWVNDDRYLVMRVSDLLAVVED